MMQTFDDSSVFIEEDLNQQIQSASASRSNRSSISNSTTNNLDDFIIYENHSAGLRNMSVVNNGGHQHSSAHFDMLMIANELNSVSNGCNMSKLKMKQEESEFYLLMNKCQNWIEVKLILLNFFILFK